jgi:hypothetical protein
MPTTVIIIKFKVYYIKVYEKKKKKKHLLPSAVLTVLTFVMQGHGVYCKRTLEYKHHDYFDFFLVPRE